MFFDYFGNVAGANLRIPNSIRIDHHRRPDRTEANRTAFGKHDASLRILPFLLFAEKNFAGEKLAFKRRLDLGAVNRRTRLAAANEHMMTNRRGDNWRKRLQFLLVTNQWILGHRNTVSDLKSQISDLNNLRKCFAVMLAQ